MWTDINSEYPPKDMPYFAKAGGYLLLCSPIGDELHITDCEQWQYTFKKGEPIEIRGCKLEYWLDLDFLETLINDCN